MISKDDGRQVICTGCGLPLEPAPPGTYPEEQPPRYTHRTPSEVMRCPGGDAQELLDSFDDCNGVQLSIWFVDGTPQRTRVTVDVDSPGNVVTETSLDFSDPASIKRVAQALDDAADYHELRRLEAEADDDELLG